MKNFISTHRLFLYFSIAGAILSLISCQKDSVCRLKTDVVMGMGVSYIVQKETDGIVKNVEMNTWDSVSVRGIGTDSMLYDNDKGAARLGLFLRNDTILTQYLIQWHNMTDTLTITHVNKFEFLSMACGTIVNHTIQTINFTHHFIDTVLLLNTEVNLIETEHLKIYLLPNVQQ